MSESVQLKLQNIYSVHQGETAKNLAITALMVYENKTLSEAVNMLHQWLGV